MKTKFSKKLLALLLGVFMVVSMIPAFVIGSNAADTESMNIYANKGSLSNKVITWTSTNFTFSNAQANSSTAIRVTDTDHFRLYQKSQATVAALNGKLLKTVVFTIAGSSYVTPMQTSITNNNDSNIAVSVSGTVLTVTFTTAVESLAFTISAQTRISNIQVTFDEGSGTTPEPDCEHTNTEPIAEVPATCTEPGMSAGTKCSDCGEELVAPEETSALGHNYVDGVCERCGTLKPSIPTNGFTLLTDVSNLQVGYRIIIVNTANSVALAGQNSNNRAQEAVVISNNFIALDGLPSAVQIITLAEGTVSGTYAFSTEEGYLYAAHSSSNYLRTKTALDANGSWAITVDGSGNATIKAQGTNAKNWLRYNSSSDLFSCYSSGQLDVQIYYLPLAACDHVWVDGAVITEGDCTTDRVVAQVCEKCGEAGENKTTEAVGHVDTDPADSKCDKCGISLCVDHVWIDGEVITEGDCTTDRVVTQVCEICGELGDNKTTTAPGHNEVPVTGKEASCIETGLTEGTHCTVCDKDIVEQEVIPMLPHNMENGTCTVCGLTGQTYNKVTSDLDDFTGTYLIVYEEGSVAFNGSLDVLDAVSNGIDVVIDNGAIAGDYLAYTFTVTKTPEGTYAIYSASGYYVGQTTDANGLKADAETVYEHTISIDGDYNAVIGVESGAQLRYNKTSNQMRFRYYKSESVDGQQPVTLYKLDGGAAPVLNTFGITLNKGVSVRVKLTVTDLWRIANPGAKVVFNDGTRDIATLDVVNDANHVYEIDLTPGQIGSTITVNLGEMSANVSVSKYIEKAKEAYADNAALVALLDAIEVYGKAAAKVEQTLAAPDFTGVSDYVLDDENGVFGGFADVVLGEYANIGLKINAEDNYTYVATLGNLSTGVKNLKDDLSTDGVLLIENLRPANFADVITVTVMNGGEEVAKITFSFNSYLKLANSTETDTLNLNIITATYNYGVAAKAYLNASAQ